MIKDNIEKLNCKKPVEKKTNEPGKNKTPGKKENSGDNNPVDNKTPDKKENTGDNKADTLKEFAILESLKFDNIVKYLEKNGYKVIKNKTDKNPVEKK